MVIDSSVLSTIIQSDNFSQARITIHIRNAMNHRFQHFNQYLGTINKYSSFIDHHRPPTITLLIEHQLLLHQSIATWKRNISSLVTQVKSTIPSKPHCIMFLGQCQVSIVNHQFLFQLSFFFVVLISMLPLHWHPVNICIYISFFCIPCRSFFLLSFFHLFIHPFLLPTVLFT